MDRVEYLGVREAAELERVSPKALLKRCERKRIVLVRDPEDARRKLMPVSALSASAYKAWNDARTLAALQGIALQPHEQPEQAIVPAAGAANLLQPALPFAPVTQGAHALLDALPSRIPESQRPYIDRWAAIVGDCTNNTFKRFLGSVVQEILIRSRGDFIRAQARTHGVSVSNIRQKLALLKGINHNPEIPNERKLAEFWTQILPKNRPGRSGHAFFSDDDNAWMREKLLSFYLTQAKLSVKRAHQLLLAEIEAKQRACGLGHFYNRPTLHQCQTLLKSLDLATVTLAREGAKAFNDRCAPYLSRDYSTLRSNDIWTTDQRLVNVRLRGAGEKLGRIWLVNFLDVASFKWLGFFFATVLSSEVVMMAAAMALERWGVPRAIQIDCGKEFNNSRFSAPANQGFKISREALFGEALGLWDRLGVRVVKAIGRNPQTKPIERWHHVIDDFDKNFPGWCGSNTDERPERLADEEAQHRAWLEGKAESTPLITIEQYVRAFAEWAETDWNARHRGRGKILQGMTPNQAFNTRRPLDGLRTLTASEVEYQTAERRFLKVARGGQVNLTFFGQKIEYAAPELFLKIGEEAEVIRSRRTLRQVTVIYPVTGGTASCTAHAKPQFHWLSNDPEECELMRQAIRCKNATRKAIKRGVAASHLALMAANPVALLESQNARPGQKVFSKPAPSREGRPPGPDNQISGAEYMMEKSARRLEFYNGSDEEAPAKKSGLDFADVV